MKRSVLLLLVFINHFLFAQRQEPLYYFVINDSLVGVKDNKGKIIIPAKHRPFLDVNTGDTLPAGLINFFEAPEKSGHRYEWKTYDRNGNLLYEPYTFEFAPDRISEGLSRFVENGRIGFVNRHGKKIIPAQFESVDEFTLGVATYCNGCTRDTAKDREHPPLVAGTFGLINRQGKVLMDNIRFDTSDVFWSWLDSLKQTFYHAEFQYNDLEKNLIKKLDRYKATIEKTLFSRFTTSLPTSLVFDIVERPGPGFPYYVIESREKIGNRFSGASWERLQFYLSETGQIIYASEYFDGLIPFKKWYSQYTQKNLP